MESVRILVVDDEAGMRLGVERTLRRFTIRLPDYDDEVSFDITQAVTGEEALELIEANKPDLLLLDHKLPGISGLDVLEAIGPDSDILTVMITAYASLETAITATKRGAYDFLAKPFTPEELKGTVRKTTKHLLLQRQARQLAEERRQVRFQFISVLAHELKAPLGAIEGYLQIMQDRSVGDDWETYEPMIDRSMVRLGGMRKLIADMLDLTRIESGTKQRELAELDLVAMAEESVETFLPQAQKRGVAIELHSEGAALMTADAGEIQIVLNNLISNAVKYNRDDGRVDVTIKANDGVVELTVADTGIGMTPEEADRLFGEFVRIKNSKTRNIAGTGLGLSILKKLCQSYGGDVTVQSTPDVGTTFTATLDSVSSDNDES